MLDGIIGTFSVSIEFIRGFFFQDRLVKSDRIWKKEPRFFGYKYATLNVTRLVYILCFLLQQCISLKNIFR